MSNSTINFLADKGTRFICVGPEVVVCPDDGAAPVKVPLSDLLNYAAAIVGRPQETGSSIPEIPA